MRKTVLFAALAASLALTGAARADITVYSAGPANLINALAAGFTKSTGIKANVFQGTTGQIMGRIEAEASNPVVDVLISASWDTATDFDKRGWLAAYTSPNAATVPDAYKTRTAVAQGISALAIAWNPKSGTPKPSEWTDLAKPEYKDLVVMPDPTQSGASFELVAAEQSLHGWKLFEDLKANGAVIGGANAAALNPVLQGAKAAVFGGVDYLAFGAAKKGESLEVIFPTSGTIVAPRPMMILNWSTKQDEARKFIDYVLSDEGQAAVAKVFLIPARTDIPAGRPLIKDIKVITVDAATVYPKRDETLAQFAKTFGR